MHQYVLFYKPYQVLSQFSPEGNKQTLADYLHALPGNVYPVGRLDYDSEGLLLLTNDTSINHQLLNPAKAHPRTYYVQTEGIITGDALQQLRDGVILSIDGKKHVTQKAKAMHMQGEPSLPARNPPIRYRANIPTSWISLTLTEGKNRQVRRMTAAVGFPTLRLVRYSIGHLTIESMLPGDWHAISKREIEKVLRTCP